MRNDWPGFGRDTHAYMRGRCADLAYALHEIHPEAEIVGIGGSVRFTDHVAIRIGDAYVDARGISDEDGFRDGLSSADGEILTLTRDDVLGQMGLAHMAQPRSPDLTKARSVAKALEKWRKVQPEPEAAPAP